MPATLQQAGIDCLEFSSDSLAMKELTGASIVRVHSLQDVLQLDTGQCSGNDPVTLCLRPKEWLLISETSSPGELMNNVQGKFEAEHTSVNGNSDGLAIFRLSGPGAPWLLSKLSGLDYLAGTAAGEHCARTKMGHVAAIVHYHQTNEEQFVFDLVVDRSFARYLWELLCESAAHADDLALAFGGAE